MAESLELNKSAASLYSSAQSLSSPPPNVLCDGTQPIGGVLNTPILLAPSPYSCCSTLIEEKQINETYHKHVNSGYILYNSKSRISIQFLVHVSNDA